MPVYLGAHTGQLPHYQSR